MSSYWQNFLHCLHRMLSVGQLPIQPLIKMSSILRHLCFSVDFELTKEFIDRKSISVSIVRILQKIYSVQKNHCKSFPVIQPTDRLWIVLYRLSYHHTPTVNGSIETMDFSNSNHRITGTGFQTGLNTQNATRFVEMAGAISKDIIGHRIASRILQESKSTFVVSIALSDGLVMMKIHHMHMYLTTYHISMG